MAKSVLLDAGPLVAFLNKEDEWHAWSVEQFKRFTHFTTCEPVLAEACARLAYYRQEQKRAIDLVTSGSILISFELNKRADRVARLLKKYSDRPMDLADACLVCMAEEVSDCVVVTLDASNFSVYRRHEREVVPCIVPPRR